MKWCGGRRKDLVYPSPNGLRESLRELFSDLLSTDRIKREGFLNSEYVTLLLQDHLANRRDNRKQLWTLLVWELWMNRYGASI